MTSEIRPIFPLPSWRLFALVVGLWALIYLPGLGTPELKGEEGRRILPGVAMLEGGSWVVPSLAGEPYLRKPPLVNWAIAGMFRLTGVRNEWTARLPSALAMLALACAIVAAGTARGWMNAETALVAAVFVMTPVGALEKGRLAEIEPLYLALSGIATVLWLAFWMQQRSPWLLWLAPSVFIGLGLLAKAPLHLLFFYAVVLAVLGHAGEWRLLRHPAHFVGLGVALAVFAAWAVPYFQAESGALAVWKAQSVGRVTGRFDWSGWVSNIPRALLDNLPWVLLTPLLWRRDLGLLEPRAQALFRGARLAVLVCFFGLLLTPGALPRYTLPLLAPFACLLALAVADLRLPPPAMWLRGWWYGNLVFATLILALSVCGPVAVAWGEASGQIAPRLARHGVFSWEFGGSLAAAAGALCLGLIALVARQRLARPALLAATTGALSGAAMLLLASAGMPFMQKFERLRPIVRSLEATVPPGSPICIYDGEYQPVLFYLHYPLQYAPRMEQIPATTFWVLTRAEKVKKLRKERPEFAVAAEFPRSKPTPLVLLQRTAPAPTQ